MLNYNNANMPIVLDEKNVPVLINGGSISDFLSFNKYIMHCKNLISVPEATD